MTTAIDIIKAFDEELEAVYGKHLGRLYPHPKDKLIADRWVAAGCTIDVCRPVFRKGQERKHVQTEPPIKCLSYFDNAVMDAIARAAKPIEDDPITSQWKARLSAWKSKKLWLEDQWGARPGEAGCRVPIKLLEGWT